MNYWGIGPHIALELKCDLEVPGLSLLGKVDFAIDRRPDQSRGFRRRPKTRPVRSGDFIRTECHRFVADLSVGKSLDRSELAAAELAKHQFYLRATSTNIGGTLGASSEIARFAKASSRFRDLWHDFRSITSASLSFKTAGSIKRPYNHFAVVDARQILPGMQVNLVRDEMNGAVSQHDIDAVDVEGPRAA